MTKNRVFKGKHPSVLSSTIWNAIGAGFRCGGFGAFQRGFGQLGNATDGTDYPRRLKRHQHQLLIGGIGKRSKCFHILLGNEIVDGLNITIGDGFRNHGGGFSFRLCQAFPRLSFPERRFLFAFSL